MHCTLTPQQISEACTRYQQGESTSSLASTFNVAKVTILKHLRRRGIPTEQRAARKLSPSQHKDIGTLYEAGESPKNLATQFKTTTSNISRILKAQKIRRRQQPHHVPKTKHSEICLRYQAGESALVIAQDFGVSSYTVRYITKHSGIKLRRPGPAYKLTTNQIEEMQNQYKDGQTIPKLAVNYKVSNHTIAYALMKGGTARRPQGECNRVHSCNHAFFSSIDSEEKAYWLGYLSADGCLYQHKTRKCYPILSVNLSSADYKHLERFKKALQSSHPIKNYIYNYKTPNQKVSRLTISSQQIGKDLIQWGVTPRKTSALKWPDFLSDELLRHYLRGIFDGDGCFSSVIKSERAIRPQASFTITATNTDFLKEMQKFLITKCSLSTTKLNPQHHSHALRYGGNNQVRRIFRLLYKNATIYLPRKMWKVFPILYPRHPAVLARQNKQLSCH